MTTYNGTAGNDILTPPTIDVTLQAIIFGYGGNDLLTGGNLNDSLYGGDGSDTLNGGDGNDYLDGGTGDDVMSGDLGNNIYVVDSANDTVNTTSGAYDTIWIYSSDPSATAFTFDMSIKAINTQEIKLYNASSTLNYNITGNALNNTITGNNGNNILLGGAGNDTIYGGGGDDTIDGGTGNDIMSGGSGDDTYYVDSAGDQVQEGTGQGNDTVFASVSYTLSTSATTGNVENLSLTGTSNLNATGNFLDNIITGNTGSNRLDGGTGADRLVGGGGLFGDSFIVDNVGDRVVADGIGDSPANNTGKGVNNIFSSISVSLVNGEGVVESGNVYNLTLTGTNNIDGSGNSLNNYISGNSGNNIIDGGAGNDYLYGLSGTDTINGGNGNDIIDGGVGADNMTGGAGSDYFYIDNVGDVVTDGDANDSIYSSISYDLSAVPNVARLNLVGTGGINGTGNALSNIIVGNSSNNMLFGGAGNDTLYGGVGSDLLVGGVGNDILNGGAGIDGFKYDNSVAFASLGIDSIVDFTAGQDIIYISKSVFGLTANINQVLSATGEFAVAANYSQAGLSTAKIVYDASLGYLIYNQNGAAAGFGSGGAFAQLSGHPTLNGNVVFAIA